MNISGPPPASVIPPVEDHMAALRLNQRFAAEVLQVAGDRVLLSVDGVRIVAHLTSSEQSAALAERKLAQFIVRDLSDSTVTVQLLNPGGTDNTDAASTAQNLIPSLLRYAGLPVNTETATIAQALLNQGLEVTPQLVGELLQLFSRVDGWGEHDAQIAAAIKALGLPLTSGTLSLSQAPLPALISLIEELYAEMLLYVKKHKGLKKELAQAVLEQLAEFTINWMDSDNRELEAQLKRAIVLLGKSVEHELARRSKSSANRGLELSQAKGLLLLADMRRSAAKEGSIELVEKLDRFFEGLRLLQYLNAEPEAEPVRGRWLRLDLPIGDITQVGQAGEFQSPALKTVRLRVAFRGGTKAPQIDPANTRFVVRVDLGNGEKAGQILQVDVSVVGKRVGATVTASGEEILNTAKAELSSLEAGLESLGYKLKTSSWEVGDFTPTLELHGSDLLSAFKEVRLEA